MEPCAADIRRPIASGRLQENTHRPYVLSL